MEVTQNLIGRKLPLLMRHGNHVTKTTAEGEGFQIDQRGISALLEKWKFTSQLFQVYSAFLRIHPLLRYFW